MTIRGDHLCSECKGFGHYFISPWSLACNRNDEGPYQMTFEAKVTVVALSIIVGLATFLLGGIAFFFIASAFCKKTGFGFDYEKKIVSNDRLEYGGTDGNHHHHCDTLATGMLLGGAAALAAGQSRSSSVSQPYVPRDYSNGWGRPLTHPQPTRHQVVQPMTFGSNSSTRDGSRAPTNVSYFSSSGRPGHSVSTLSSGSRGGGSFLPQTRRRR